MTKYAKRVACLAKCVQQYEKALTFWILPFIVYSFLRQGKHFKIWNVNICLIPFITLTSYLYKYNLKTYMKYKYLLFSHQRETLFRWENKRCLYLINFFQIATEGNLKNSDKKPFEQRTRTNTTLNPHVTPGLGIEPRPQWWETITPSPPLLIFAVDGPSTFPNPSIWPLTLSLFLNFTTKQRIE